MIISFYRPTRERHKIVIEASAFPSDRYAVESQIRFHGFDVADSLIEIKPRENETTLRIDDIEKTITENADSIALILLGGMNYYTGQTFDFRKIVEAGYKAGAVVGFDLAHAAGNVKLHDWNANFAAWRSYKYLNAGPGGIGGGSFPATIARIEHGFDVRPDLCVIDNNVNPRQYLGKFWLDSLVHEKLMLEYLVKLVGADKIALGTDYPFPLGESEPGKLIESSNFDEAAKAKMLHGAALEWLNLDKNLFI